ncbi:MAG: malic enzyme-like NAD(P)-binding protein [Vicinamibacterales bacterium]
MTWRVRLPNQPGVLGRVATAIGEAHGSIGAIDIVEAGRRYLVRDVTIDTSSALHADEITNAIQSVSDVEVVHVSDPTFLLHLGGKIQVASKIPLRTRADLSMAYTPGVARVCEAIRQDPQKAFNLTIKRNSVAIVTDGTAVLGLGDIGPAAAMPVMEGKAMLFKEFAGIDAFPIALSTRDPDEIVRTVKNIAVAFGGINLEDISAPRCFGIEERLREELDIPVFHDDQHGTAVVVLAGLINALKIVGKSMSQIRVVVSGTGAAGTACTKILLAAGVTDLVGCDEHGAVYRGRDAKPPAHLDWYAQATNPENRKGALRDVIPGADVFIGVSVGGALAPDDMRRMAPGAIVFAMANPVPEIWPEVAAPYAAVVATGRSDYPNQVNNVLCFPGIFKGALACRASDINEPMKLAAAEAIAGIVGDAELGPDYIIPSVFDTRVVERVAQNVESAARASGVARSPNRPPL